MNLYHNFLEMSDLRSTTRHVLTQNFATFAELKCEKILGTESKIFDWWLHGSISESAYSVRKLPLHNHPNTCPRYLVSCISSWHITNELETTMLRAVTLVTTVTRDTVTWMEIRSECSIKVDSHAQTQGVHNSTIQGVWGRWWCCAHARAQVVVSSGRGRQSRSCHQLG